MCAAPATNKRIKLVVAGAGGSGKTTLLTRLRIGEFTRSYVATMGVEVNPSVFHTNRGTMVANVWDTAGGLYGGLGMREYARGAEAALVVFDVTSRPSYKRAVNDLRLLRADHPHIPIVLCGNKIDCRGRQVTDKEIQDSLARGSLRGLRVQYVDVSAKSCVNMEKPFLHLLREATGDPALELVEGPARVPPTVTISQEQLRQWSLEEEKEEDVEEEEEQQEFEAAWKQDETAAVRTPPAAAPAAASGGARAAERVAQVMGHVLGVPGRATCGTALG